MVFLKLCYKSLRSTSFFSASILFLLVFATLFLYHDDLYYPPKSSLYVYEFPNKEVPYPTLFLANKKRLCIPDATVTVQSGGRLGNIIMEYASAWALINIYNLTAFVQQDMKKKLQDVFQPLSIPSSMEFLKTKTSCRPVRGWGHRLTDIVGTKKKIDMNMVSLYSIVEVAKKRHKLIVLEICVILPEVIVPLAGRLGQEFKYHPKLTTQAQKSLMQLRDTFHGDHKKTDGQVSFVGVHVRRTDYKAQLKLLYNATHEAGVDYYRRAVSWMRRTLSQTGPEDIVFVVTSDDPAWCKETLIPALGVSDDSLGRYAVYWSGSSSPAQDLALLSSCNHSIFAYGTYGMWSALMAGGHTVVYDITGGEVNKHIHGYSPAMQFARNMDKWVALW